MHRLRERTGGWPAALRIAALAVRGQPDPERWVGQFGGDQPEIAGYLHEEVLATLDPAEEDLLRRTAVVDTVCADLAEALTGRADAGQVLADLAGTGGLLHREDTRPPWYRYESLLADLLRADLARLPADGATRAARPGRRLVRGRRPTRRRACGTPWPPAAGTWPVTCSSRTGRS